MTLDEAKLQFIQLWGTLGSQWGISRTMAQLHALLLTEPEPISAEEVMERLQISRGNTNQNMRALIDWGLVTKQFRPGDRKEYFLAEKDVWTVARQILRHRRKREVAPILEALRAVRQAEGAGPGAEHFRKMLNEIYEFVALFEELSEMALRLERANLLKTILSLLPLRKPD